MITKKQQKLADFVWSIANKLRGPYRPPQYRRVIAHAGRMPDITALHFRQAEHYAQKWTAAIDWRSVDKTRRELDACDAFLDPTVAEEEGRQLRMPGRAAA